MITRGERIAQKQRNRERWRRIYRWRARLSPSSAAWAERNVLQAAQHGKLCSCPMCGNPRRHFGDETIQERRAARALDLCELEIA